MEDNFKWNDELVKEFAKKFDAFECTPTDNDISKFKQSEQQSVEKKDYEIVDRYKKCIDGFWTGEVILRTIRRLSDNETFTINELTQYGSKIQSFQETKFGLLANMGSFKVPVEDLVKRKIDNKDWEILSFKGEWGGHKDVEFNFNPYSGFYIPYHAMPTYGEYKYTVSDLLKEEAKIHSVKRLSDNEAFTVGDKIDWSNLAYNTPIRKFVVEYNRMIVFGESFGGDLANIRHAMQRTPLFHTEDNVPIYEGDEYWYVVDGRGKDNYWIPQKVNAIAAKYHTGSDNTCKFFSTEQTAKEYILMNKPCLSIKEVMNAWPKMYPSLGTESKLKELVKQKQ